jgi:hypothetical protein
MYRRVIRIAVLAAVLLFLPPQVAVAQANHIKLLAPGNGLATSANKAVLD